MSIRYVEFDSRFRDRTLYPMPSTFVVEASQTSQGNRFDAKDPVCNSSPILYWNNTFIEEKTVAPPNNSIVTGITASPLTLDSSQGNTVFQITTALAGKKLRQVRNFYFGATLNIDRVGPPPYTVIRKIIDYKPINVHNAIVTLDYPLPDSVIGLNTFTIVNPTLISPTVLSTIMIFTPVSNQGLSTTETEQTYGIGGDNYYINYYMQDTDTGTARKIIAFDGNTRLSTLETEIPPGENWRDLANNLTIRKELPIRITGDSLSDNQLQLDATASTVNNYYVGSFLRIPPQTIPGVIERSVPYVPPVTEERKIVNYDSTTRIVTVEPPFTGLIPYVGPPAILLEILPFSRDNATQFNFTGPISTSSQTETYEIKLLNLILPNTLLSSGKGGRAIFYPYFYVELRQLSTGTSQSFNVLYSNNTNSYKMLFRAVVDDTVKPEFSPFIKIDGDRMTHTLRIKPDDTFRFSVYHANGELFKTVIEDTKSPTEPNPLAQISACFAFKKV